MNAVSGLLSSSILTCQYPDFRSRAENHWVPCRLSRVLSIWGSKYASFTVQLLSFLRSMLNLRLPSFFQTRTTVLAHRLCNGWIADIQHFLDMGPHVILHVRGYVPVMLLKGHLVWQLYFMLDQSSSAQIQVTVCKQVFSFEQQLPGLFLLWLRLLGKALEV